MPGPPRTPTAILKARGSWLADRNSDEPLPEKGIPDLPDGFDGEVKAVWDELTEILDAMNVLTKADRLAVERYCGLVVIYRDLKKFIDERGTVYPVKDKQGNVIGMEEFPQFKQMCKLADLLHKAESHFGLNPAARSRIRMEPTPANDGKEKTEKFLKLG